MSTNRYLKKNGMNSFTNNYDPIESIIFEKGLRIRGLHFYTDMDLMIIVLNNQKVLIRNISQNPGLAGVDTTELNRYELIAEGVGIHWPTLDEDLSLKMFLKEELINQNPVGV